MLEGGSLMAHFTLDGRTLKTPRKFKMDYYNLTKSNRLLNGRMSMELIAVKRKFYLTYDEIACKDLDPVINLLFYQSKVFFKFTYEDGSKNYTATVYTGDVSKELHRAEKGNGNWVYKDVEIHLIEV